MRRIALGAVAVTLSGCALMWHPSNSIVARAERLVHQGDYVAAMQAYDEAIAKYPEDAAPSHVRAARESLGGLLAARADAARLRETLAARESELTKLRGELQRLTAEAERLRADLEQLKQIDLRQERRRR